MSNKIRIAFAKRLKQARELAGLSQRELGLLVGLSDKSISAYEQGRVLPPLDILPKIAKYLDKPISYFLSEENVTDTLLLKIEQLEDFLSELKGLVLELKEKDCNNQDGSSNVGK